MDTVEQELTGKEFEISHFKKSALEIKNLDLFLARRNGQLVSLYSDALATLVAYPTLQDLSFVSEEGCGDLTSL